MENFTDDEVEYIRNLFEGINCTIDVVKKDGIYATLYTYIFLIIVYFLYSNMKTSGFN
jgi:hypothetical protein